MAEWQRICLPMQETRVQSLGWEDPLEDGTATHSRLLAWRTRWTEEPGGYIRGVTRVRRDLARGMLGRGWLHGPQSPDLTWSSPPELKLQLESLKGHRFPFGCCGERGAFKGDPAQGARRPPLTGPPFLFPQSVVTLENMSVPGTRGGWLCQVNSDDTQRER